MLMNRRQSLQFALVSAFGPSFAWAQSGEFPSKPVTVYVPYAPGGTIDLSARALSKSAEKFLGAPVLVVNRPGAGGSISTDAMVRSAPDGYTLAVVAPSNLTITPQIQKVPYDPFKDIAPVMNFAATTIYMVVRKDSPLRSLTDYVAQAKSKPEPPIIAITAIGAGTHLATARLMKERGAPVEFVTFNGGAQIITALMGRHVDVGVLSGEVLPSIMSGDLRVLASFSRETLPALKAAPTIQQSGSEWEPDSWIGLGAPGNTPKKVREILEKAFLAASLEPEYLRVLEELAMLPRRMDGEELTKALHKSFDENGRLLREIGLIK